MGILAPLAAAHNVCRVVVHYAGNQRPQGRLERPVRYSARIPRKQPDLLGSTVSRQH